MHRVLVACVLTVASLTPTTSTAAERWDRLPTSRLSFGLDLESATAVTASDTPHALAGGGFGIFVGFHLPLGLVQPFFEGSLFANLVSRETPCTHSPFDPDTLVCEHPGSPVRALGAMRLGARFLPPLNDEGRLGLTAGVQYFVQSLESSSSVAIFEPLLPYAQVDWAGGNFVASAAVGFGGYAMVEFATPFRFAFFDTLMLRLERLDLRPGLHVPGDLMASVMVGTLDSVDLDF